MFYTDQPAVVRYGSPGLEVLEVGGFGRCAVSGEPIRLDALSYWSAEHQEAYRGPAEWLAAKQAGGGRFVTAR